MLAKQARALELLVVEEGCRDGTAGEVEAAVGPHPLVRVRRQPNSGKATALNRAIEQARGEILICLDADTLFTPATIGRLLRRFADPRIGSVAGNVKLGNRVHVCSP